MERCSLAAALWVTIVGGIAGAIIELTDLPAAFALVAASVWLAGAVVVLVCTVWLARRSGRSLGVSLWAGIRAFVRWMP
jgi:hypothetical protein